MLTVQLESCISASAECVELLQEHYEALSLHQHHGLELAPQWEAYAAREARGEILCATLREAGKLVGYFVGVVAPGMHYKQCLTLITDMFYVAKSHRGRRGGLKLFKFVEAEARRRGCRAFFTSHKLHEPEASRLFGVCGFEPVETHYCKWLED